MFGEEIVDLRHRRETFRKDLLLQCKCLSHNSFVIDKLCIRIDLILPVDTPQVGLVGNGVRARVSEPGVDSELAALSDKADCEVVAGAGTSADPEASYDHKTPKEPDAPSSLVADPEGVLDSVCSSSE